MHVDITYCFTPSLSRAWQCMSMPHAGFVLDERTGFESFLLHGWLIAQCRMMSGPVANQEFRIRFKLMVGTTKKENATYCFFFRQRDIHVGHIRSLGTERVILGSPLSFFSHHSLATCSLSVHSAEDVH
jgi:hypothetical protein